MSIKSIIHIICGPTASGKSAQAMVLAGAENGVIINCDSMQLYDGLPIITAQPSGDDKAQIPHKLYGVLDPNDACSAGNWREIVIPVIEEALENGQTPIICGGTGLYIKALTQGLSPMPDIPDHVREQTIQTYNDLGRDAFFAQLQKRDPVIAARFHAGHKARIMRAWDVLEATGKSLAEWQELPRTPPPAEWDFQICKVMPDRDVLYQRCNDRFLQMMEQGALDEVRDFKDKIEQGVYKSNIPLAKALGFPTLSRYLDDEMSLDEAVVQAQIDTRRYAKRQVTWFKNQI